ncbi:hypothetical protein ACFCWG_14610 [Streptomyces sp. NPDC056390]|uniref:hypothetical protein n=1 Tax=Streptomyces sp. NPDC056390 TaxID=3345806 RepID=UPI0035DB6612
MAVDRQEVPGSPSVAAVGSPVPAVKRRAGCVLALLVCPMLVNFADKVVVALSGVRVMEELGLDSSRFGVLAAFGAVFAVLRLLGGDSGPEGARAGVLTKRGVGAKRPSTVFGIIVAA